MELMNFGSSNLTTALDIFLLLLIGIGPKIALVPFLDSTAKLSGSERSAVIRKMVSIAFTVAFVLTLFGGILTRLLHFSLGALSIASGLILLTLAIPMVLINKDPSIEKQASAERDPLGLAVSPLAIPYLLNPVGIVVLVTASAESQSLRMLGIVIFDLLLVFVLDVLVFRWANRVSSNLDAGRMIVVEKVFGFLLAALAVELALKGLHTLGLIHLPEH
jgi:multiple antibiotic resistance protein